MQLVLEDLGSQMSKCMPALILNGLDRQSDNTATGQELWHLYFFLTGLIFAQLAVDIEILFMFVYETDQNF
jgi:hypothetical protein